jgi:hypothetical protein
MMENEGTTQGTNESAPVKTEETEKKPAKTEPISVISVYFLLNRRLMN